MATENSITPKLETVPFLETGCVGMDRELQERIDRLAAHLRALPVEQRKSVVARCFRLLKAFDNGFLTDDREKNYEKLFGCRR